MEAALVAHREEVRFAQDCAVEEARQRHDQVIEQPDLQTLTFIIHANHTQPTNPNRHTSHTYPNSTLI